MPHDTFPSAPATLRWRSPDSASVDSCRWLTPPSSMTTDWARLPSSPAPPFVDDWLLVNELDALPNRCGRREVAAPH